MHPDAIAMDEHQWTLPVFKDVTQLKMTDEQKEQEEIAKNAMREFTDVKFYPFTEPGVDPIFAALNARHILICRATSTNNGKAYEVLQAIKDTEEDCKMYSCVWSKDPITGTPLLLAGGENANIRIYDVLKGTLSRTLIGIGGRINDMAICPTNPNILATATGDDRATVWNIHPENAKQPIMLILAGTGGHRESLLSVSFHQNGQYLVTGGEDKMVKVWYLPESAYPPPMKTKVIQYPSFSTSAVHSGHVECVKFFGDLIISKAHQEDFIVLWKIEGFSSSIPAPPTRAQYLEDVLSTTYSDFNPETKGDHSETWSAYTRLIQFAVPDCLQLYMRFGLYYPFPSSKYKHPILSFCNSKSRVFFWDLTRLNLYAEYIDAVLPTETASKAPDEKNSTPKPPKPSWLQLAKPRKHHEFRIPRMPNYPSESPSRRSISPSSTTLSNATAAKASTPNTEQRNTPFDPNIVISEDDLKRSKRHWDEMYSTAFQHRWRPLRAHKSFTIPVYEFTGRQVAWDSNGEWCVVAGSENVIAVCGR